MQTFGYSCISNHVAVYHNCVGIHNLNINELGKSLTLNTSSITDDCCTLQSRLCWEERGWSRKEREGGRRGSSETKFTRANSPHSPSYVAASGNGEQCKWELLCLEQESSHEWVCRRGMSRGGPQETRATRGQPLRGVPIDAGMPIGSYL